MPDNYFFQNQANQFAFYRVPKVLFSDWRYSEISADAKILYGMMLDRMSLSKKHSLIDEEGRVYIFFTVSEIKDVFRCAEKKAIRILDELERCNLIDRKRNGQGKPNRIYPKNFVSDVQGRK